MNSLSALIALLLILFLGLVMFSIVCCCLKNWDFAKAAAKSWNKPQKLRETSPKLEDGLRTLSIIGANGIYNAPTSIMDEGPAGTDNPLWIDQKYKGMLEHFSQSNLSKLLKSYITLNGQIYLKYIVQILTF